MHQAILREFDEPRLERPVFVAGLPGVGNVGRIAAQMLIESFRGRLFAELYSPSLPDFVIVNDQGICRLPSYQFWACSASQPNLVVVTGEYNLSPSAVQAHYEVCSLMLDLAGKYNCKWIVTLDGYGTPPARSGKVFIASTSSQLTRGAVEAHGALPYHGRIVGISGLLLGLARLRGMGGYCILGSTTGLMPDHVVAARVYGLMNDMMRRGAFSAPQ